MNISTVFTPSLMFRVMLMASEDSNTSEYRLRSNSVTPSQTAFTVNGVPNPSRETEASSVTGTGFPLLAEGLFYLIDEKLLCDGEISARKSIDIG